MPPGCAHFGQVKTFSFDGHPADPEHKIGQPWVPLQTPQTMPPQGLIMEKSRTSEYRTLPKLPGEQFVWNAQVETGKWPGEFILTSGARSTVLHMTDLAKALVPVESMPAGAKDFVAELPWHPLSDDDTQVGDPDLSLAKAKVTKPESRVVSSVSDYKKKVDLLEKEDAKGIPSKVTDFIGMSVQWFGWSGTVTAARPYPGHTGGPFVLDVDWKSLDTGAKIYDAATAHSPKSTWLDSDLLPFLGPVKEGAVQSSLIGRRVSFATIQGTVTGYARNSKSRYRICWDTYNTSDSLWTEAEILPYLVGPKKEDTPMSDTLVTDSTTTFTIGSTAISNGYTLLGMEPKKPYLWEASISKDYVPALQRYIHLRANYEASNAEREALDRALWDLHGISPEVYVNKRMAAARDKNKGDSPNQILQKMVGDPIHIDTIKGMQSDYLEELHSVGKKEPDKEADKEPTQAEVTEAKEVANLRHQYIRAIAADIKNGEHAGCFHGDLTQYIIDYIGPHEGGTSPQEVQQVLLATPGLLEWAVTNGVKTPTQESLAGVHIAQWSQTENEAGTETQVVLKGDGEGQREVLHRLQIFLDPGTPWEPQKTQNHIAQTARDTLADHIQQHMKEALKDIQFNFTYTPAAHEKIQATVNEVLRKRLHYTVPKDTDTVKSLAKEIAVASANGSLKGQVQTDSKTYEELLQDYIDDPTEPVTWAVSRTDLGAELNSRVEGLIYNERVKKAIGKASSIASTHSMGVAETKPNAVAFDTVESLANEASKYLSTPVETAKTLILEDITGVKVNPKWAFLPKDLSVRLGNFLDLAWAIGALDEEIVKWRTTQGWASPLREFGYGAAILANIQACHPTPLDWSYYLPADLKTKLDQFITLERDKVWKGVTSFPRAASPIFATGVIFDTVESLANEMVKAKGYASPFSVELAKDEILENIQKDRDRTDWGTLPVELSKRLQAFTEREHRIISLAAASRRKISDLPSTVPTAPVESFARTIRDNIQRVIPSHIVWSDNLTPALKTELDQFITQERNNVWGPYAFTESLTSSPETGVSTNKPPETIEPHNMPTNTEKKMPTTKTRKVANTFKAELGSAATKTAARQLAKAVRDPLLEFLVQSLGADKRKATKFLASPTGLAITKLVVGSGLGALPMSKYEQNEDELIPANRLAQVASVMREDGLADLGDGAMDLLTGPLFKKAGSLLATINTMADEKVRVDVAGAAEEGEEEVAAEAGARAHA